MGWLTDHDHASVGSFLRSISRWRLHDILLVLFIVVSPLSGFAAFTVGDVGVRFTWVVGALLVGLGVLRVGSRKRLSFSTPLVLILLWFGWAVVTGIVPLSAGNATYIREFLFGIARYGLFVGVIVAVMNFGLKERTLYRLFRVLAIVATVVSLYAIYQFFARQYGLPFAYLHLSNPSLPVSVQVGSTYYTDRVFARVTSVFMEPSWLGMYLLSAIIVVAVPLFYERSQEILFADRWKNVAVLSLLLLAFVLAYSLGAYASLTAVVPVFVFFDWPRVRSSLPETLGPPVLLYAAFDAITERGRITKVVLSRIYEILLKVVNKIAGISINVGPKSDESDKSTASSGGSAPPGEEVRSSLGTRVAEVQSSIDVWAYHPLLGVGTNNFQFYSSTGKPAISFGYTLVLAEEGLIGLVLLLVFFGFLLYRLFEASGGFQPKSLDARQVVLRTFLYVILADLVSTAFRLQFHLIRFWFYVGLAVVALSIFTDGNREINLRDWRHA